MLSLYKRVNALEKRQDNVNKFFREKKDIALRCSNGKITIPDGGRFNVVGASDTGKSTFVRDMVFARKFPHIYIYSPSEVSLKQNTWNCFPQAIKVHLKPRTPPLNFKSKSVIIFDDVDAVMGNLWIQKLYTIESHHSDLTIIKISHKIKCNDTELRTSTNYLVLFYMPSNDIDDVCKLYGLGSDERRKVDECLEQRSGLVRQPDGTCKGYNKCMIDMRNLAMDDGSKRDRIYFFDNIICG